MAEQKKLSKLQIQRNMINLRKILEARQTAIQKNKEMKQSNNPINQDEEFRLPSSESKTKI